MCTTVVQVVLVLFEKYRGGLSLAFFISLKTHESTCNAVVLSSGGPWSLFP